MPFFSLKLASNLFFSMDGIIISSIEIIVTSCSFLSQERRIRQNNIFIFRSFTISLLLFLQYQKTHFRLNKVLQQLYDNDKFRQENLQLQQYDHDKHLNLHW